jgi:hypothetical protein
MPQLKRLRIQDSSPTTAPLWRWFRHIDRCRNLERLRCTYCRETGDAAAEYIREFAITEVGQAKADVSFAKRCTDAATNSTGKPSHPYLIPPWT